MMKCKFVIGFLFLIASLFSCSDNDVETTLAGEWRNEGESVFLGNVLPEYLEYINDGVSFKIGGEVYVGVGNMFSRVDNGEGDFHVDRFPGAARKGAVAFVIGTKAYVGLGYSSAGGKEVYYDDFWVYDGEKRCWEPELLSFPFPGGARSNAVAFCLGNTAYVGTGRYERESLSDFYTFEPEKGWKKFTSIAERHVVYGAVAFVADGCAYMCTGGRLLEPLEGDKMNYYLFVGMLKLSPGSDQWEPLGPVDGEEGMSDIRRIHASCFVLNRGGKDYAYIVSGANKYNRPLASVMEFNPRKEKWQEVAYLPEPTVKGVGFTLDGKEGFVTVDRDLGKYWTLWKFKR